MISVQEAKRIVEDVIPCGNVATCPVRETLGRVLAEDLRAPSDSPRFDSSAMDGYAVHDATAREWRVIGTITAGDIPTSPLHAGETMRIMTGAVVPEGTTAIIPQENVRHDGSIIRVETTPLAGAFIRRRGEELKTGAIALSRSTLITPAVIGHLIALGFTAAPIFTAPRVAILPTGNELVRDSSALAPGKIIESSSHALAAVLRELYLEPTPLPPCRDRRTDLARSISAALETNDVVLIAGGVSVGEYDLVKEVLTELGCATLFWQVAQKPGMPLYFGRCGQRFVFGLPGNPASSLVCCYEYVVPAVRRWLGHSEIWPRTMRARLSEPLTKQDTKTHFVRAYREDRADGAWVRHAALQGSHLMKSFAEANCLLVIPSEIRVLAAGDDVVVHLL